MTTRKLDDKESTPLLFSPKGGGRLDPGNNNAEDGPTRRRTAAQHQTTHYFASKFDPPPPPPPPQSKKRTRHNISIIRKISNALSTIRNSKPSLDDVQDSSRQFYEDTYNDLPWRCSFGTSQDDGIWLNRNDTPGLIMSSLVWLMIIYSGLTVTLLAKNNSLPSFVSITYCTLCALALASHAKTTFTDPGSIPHHAVPTEQEGCIRKEFPMCSVCETYKPPKCHHCRICNRCVSGMDHHCPWMNNCIGSGNLKHFILFLCYVWVASAYALILFGLNYFLCNNEECIFPNGLVALVRLMTMLCIGALIFTTNMIVSVFWAIMTGMGTIDRMKKLEMRTFDQSDEAPIPWTHVFGVGPYITWLFPLDPIFHDYDEIMGYSNTQRLVREKNMTSGVV